MRTFGKWLGRILLALILAGIVVWIWKGEEIKRLLAVNSLFAEDRIVENFSNMEGAFLTTPVSRGAGPTSPLPYGPEWNLPEEVTEWVEARDVTSLLVLQEGEIIYENYFLGTGPEDRRISWSVAKSFISALVGILIEEGQIEGLDVPVTRYAPSLEGSAYEGVTLRQVLQMSSGVTFDEDYLDYNSDINRMGRVLALGGEIVHLTAELSETFQEPGTGWQYVSIDTHVVSMVVRGATGRSLAELLSEKIIVPLGLEREGYYVTDGVGTAFALGGLNLMTRDYARFGQMFLQQGEWQGQQIVPADWVAASTRRSAPTAPGAIGYGYQWWIPEGSPDGTYMARGIYGQYIWIDEAARVVIVTTAADRGFREPGVSQRNVDIFRLITERAADGT
ncbi:MAG: serine hydrolase [Sulfitobacter sp.]|nr:serine hydrolase [Sulfitobacter sp.]